MIVTSHGVRFSRRAAASPAKPPPMITTWGTLVISSILEKYGEACRCSTESHVQTACPLDCPDACTLDVTLRSGRITKIDGSTENHITNGYICAKVRGFHERVYGDDRLLYPAVRRGPKGSGQFTRVTWDDALELIAGEDARSAAQAGGAETILPLCYGGSNGFMTQDYADAILFRRLGTSRLLRTVCAAPTGAANQGLYGKMASVSYEDYPSPRR